MKTEANCVCLLNVERGGTADGEASSLYTMSLSCYVLSVMSADVYVDRGTSHTCVTRDVCVSLANCFSCRRPSAKTTWCLHCTAAQTTCTAVGIFEGSISIKLHLRTMKGFHLFISKSYFTCRDFP